ncbi:C-terminal domain of homeodomain 1-domain-containing protein [Scleroderma yunnanense]
MKNDIYHRLQLAEGHFMSALTEGPDALASYDHCWATLLKDLSSASLSGNASKDTVSLAHSVAFRISSIAGCFLAVQHEQQMQTTQLYKDWDAIFHQMETSHRCSSPEAVHYTPQLPSSAPPSDHGSPSFLPLAYKWLLDNLHNPYPSTEVKAHIATTSGCAVSSINSWFISARRRIGWTPLCRNKFNNCRADMVDAAYHVFIKQDPSHRVSSEIAQAFMTIRVAAEGLYASTFSKSPFAAELDAVVRDMTEGDQLWRDEEGRGTLRRRVSQVEGPERSIPSSNSSSSPSPLASAASILSSSDSDDDTDLAPPILVGSKRRASQAPESLEDETLCKRSRICDTSADLAYNSPRRALSCLIQSEDRMGTPPITSTRCRKRRLSDTGDNLPKRPRGMICGPRVQAVSDPLPWNSTVTERNFDDWFNLDFANLFEVPPPVHSEVPDQSTLWEVELFNDYSLSQLPQQTDIPHSSVDSRHPLQPDAIDSPQDRNCSPSLASAVDDPELVNFLQSAGILELPPVANVEPLSQKPILEDGILPQDTPCLWGAQWSDASYMHDCTGLDRHRATSLCDSLRMGALPEISFALQPLLSPTLVDADIGLATSQGFASRWSTQSTMDPILLAVTSGA